MKDHHINVFWSDEDDCYVADIPDFEYCSAFGDTPEEALAEVLIAKQGWIEPRESLARRSQSRDTGRSPSDPSRLGRLADIPARTAAALLL